MNKTILFVCKHNRFRSKVAEAFFNKLNKNKNYAAVSAGLIPGGYPLDKMQVAIARKFGLRLHGRPKPITTDLLKKMDLMVIAADNVPASLFHNKKYNREEVLWKIKDSIDHKSNETREIISEIEKRVIELVRSLK